MSIMSLAIGGPSAVGTTVEGSVTWDVACLRVQSETIKKKKKAANLLIIEWLGLDRTSDRQRSLPCCGQRHLP